MNATITRRIAAAAAPTGSNCTMTMPAGQSGPSGPSGPSTMTRAGQVNAAFNSASDTSMPSSCIGNH